MAAGTSSSASGHIRSASTPTQGMVRFCPISCLRAAMASSGLVGLFRVVSRGLRTLSISRPPSFASTAAAQKPDQSRPDQRRMV